MLCQSNQKHSVSKLWSHRQTDWDTDHIITKQQPHRAPHSGDFFRLSYSYGTHVYLLQRFLIMALKLHSLIIAVLISLVLVTALMPTTAVAQSEPDRMEAAADPGLISNFQSDFMKAVVKRYREMIAAISRALSNDPQALNPGKPSVGKPFVPPVVSTPTPQTPAKPYVPPVYTPPAYTPPGGPASSIGSARLTWNIPTRRENGELLPVGEIASYEIYMTAESNGASRTIRVSDPSKTQFTLVPLAADTYHFSMATIDVDGTYSGLSQVVSKTVR